MAIHQTDKHLLLSHEKKERRKRQHTFGESVS